MICALGATEQDFSEKLGGGNFGICKLSKKNRRHNIWHRHCPSPWVCNNGFSNWHSNFVLMIHGDQRQHSQFWQIFILGQNSVKLLASYKFNLTRRTMTLPVCQMQLLCTLMNWNCFILQNWGKQWRADISFSTKTLHFPSMFISSAKTIAALDVLLRLVRLLRGL